MQVKMLMFSVQEVDTKIKFLLDMAVYYFVFMCSKRMTWIFIVKRTIIWKSAGLQLAGTFWGFCLIKTSMITASPITEGITTAVMSSIFDPVVSVAQSIKLFSSSSKSGSSTIFCWSEGGLEPACACPGFSTFCNKNSSYGWQDLF